MTLERRPAVAAGRHYMQADGPSNGSASIEDGCVITGDCDVDQLFGASRQTDCYCFAVGQQLGHEKSTLGSRAQLIVVASLVTDDNDLYENTSTEF